MARRPARALRQLCHFYHFCLPYRLYHTTALRARALPLLPCAAFCWRRARCAHAATAPTLWRSAVPYDSAHARTRAWVRIFCRGAAFPSDDFATLRAHRGCHRTYAPALLGGLVSFLFCAFLPFAFSCCWRKTMVVWCFGLRLYAGAAWRAGRHLNFLTVGMGRQVVVLLLPLACCLPQSSLVSIYTIMCGMASCLCSISMRAFLSSPLMLFPHSLAENNKQLCASSLNAFRLPPVTSLYSSMPTISCLMAIQLSLFSAL